MSASSSNALFANRSVSLSLPSRGLLPPRREGHPASADPARDGAIRVESRPGQDTVRPAASACPGVFPLCRS